MDQIFIMEELKVGMKKLVSDAEKLADDTKRYTARRKKDWRKINRFAKNNDLAIGDVRGKALGRYFKISVQNGILSVRFEQGFSFKISLGTGEMIFTNFRDPLRPVCRAGIF